MELIIIAIILAVILGVVQYFKEKTFKACGSYYKHVISFSAGIAITYLFLDLFPSFSEKVLKLNQLLFIFLLIGFVVIHLVEKYISTFKRRICRKKIRCKKPNYIIYLSFFTWNNYS